MVRSKITKFELGGMTKPPFPSLLHMMGPFKCVICHRRQWCKRVDWAHAFHIHFVYWKTLLREQLRTCGLLWLNPSRDAISDEAEVQLWAFYDPITNSPSPYSILLFRLILPLRYTPDPGAMWFDLGIVHMLLWCVNRAWVTNNQTRPGQEFLGCKPSRCWYKWYEGVLRAQSVLSNGEVGFINHHQCAQTITKPVYAF